MGHIRSLVTVVGTLAALVLAGGQAVNPEPASAAPPNDNFANAITLVATATDPVIASGTTAAATTQAGEPTSCFTGATVWFNWTSPAFTAAVSFDAYGSTLDTVLGVYTGNAVNALTGVGCSDQFGGPQGGVAFNFAPSTTYRIQLGGSLGATGNFVLNVSFGASMVVNTTADSATPDNFLSLREAMLAAKHASSPCAILTPAEQAQVLSCGWGGLAAADLVHFNPGVFPPGGPASILLLGALPTMVSADTVSGIGAGVVIDGQGFGPGACISLAGSANALQGLDVRNCHRGIEVAVGGTGNLIGIDVTNPLVLTEERNIIRENGTGVRMANAAGGNIVAGNYIGTNESGAAGLGNGFGIWVESSISQQIGFPGPGRNVISGNAQTGIQLVSSSQVSISGNMIGTNAAGTAAIPNGKGIVLQDSGQNSIGGTSASQRNIISGNTISGIEVSGVISTRNHVLGNYIGLNAAGAAVLPNGSNGVLIDSNASSNLIGGDTAGARNVISGNGAAGVRMDTTGGGVARYASTDVPKAIPDVATATSTIVIPERARITDVNVTLDITHTFDGDLTISLSNPDGVTTPLSIRNGSSGDNYTNTTFDDMTPGILISDGTPPFTGTWFPQGNLTQFEGGSTKGTWTLIVQDSAGADIGTINSWSLQFTTEGNQVSGNYIGTDATGAMARGNDRGVFVDDSQANTIGGTVAGERNVISGNSGPGIRLRSPGTQGNRVSGNYIGLSAGGNTDLGNGLQGILISDGASNNTVGGGTGERNVISGNEGAGLEVENVESTGNLIQGNYIGTNAAGSADLGNSSHGVWLDTAGPTTIGVAGSGNVISGNGQDGIQVLVSTGTAIRGNLVGTDATGMLAIGNSSEGISIINSSGNIVGGPTSQERNLVSGNVGKGIQIGNPDSNFNGVYGNYIGTKADGVSRLGNGAGITIFGGASFNDIGTPVAGYGNTIAHNSTTGIALSPTGGNPTDNEFSRNSIFGNGGLGIDIGLDGVTPNDSGDGDSGPNERQNHPQLLSATHSAGSVTISGSLNSLPFNAYLVEFFLSPTCDPSGYGEGASYMGFSSVGTDASGDGAFIASFPGPTAGFITATAIDDDVDDVTSEFSSCVAIGSPGDDDGDGYTNSAESGTPLCTAAGDDDGDGTANDGCPGGPGQVGAWSEAQFKIGTGAQDACGYNGWPSNVHDGGGSANRLDINDIVSFLGPTRRLDKNPGQVGFDTRWDLAPGRGAFASFINVQDLALLLSGTTGNPPMLGNVRAFDKTCPLPP
jgi:subtilisin-like proprotein convertase family protein